MPGWIGQYSPGVAVAVAWVIVELTRSRSKSRRQLATAKLNERELLSLDQREWRLEIMRELATVKQDLAQCQSAHAGGVLERLELAAALNVTRGELAETQEKLAVTQAELAETRRLLERVRTGAVTGTIVLEPEAPHE